MTRRSRQIAEEIATDEQRDRYECAREQAQAQFESIREMVEALRQTEKAGEDGDDQDSHAFDLAQQVIQEDALSVEVRSDWEEPGMFCPERQVKPAEYRILLCTGGPAVQITGKLSEHGEPERARLEMQDWFLPWTEYRPEMKRVYAEDSQPYTAAERADFAERHAGDAEEILLAYARQFYFGE